MPDETDGLFPPAGARDWPEDSAHENGRYWCTCSTCGQRFVGHKRRVVCRTCSMPDETQEREGSRDAVVVPRRIDRLRHTPAERAITDAMQVVEEMAADVRLTQAVILLGRARDLVADYVDGMPYRPAVDGPHAVIRAQEVTIDRLRRERDEAREWIDRAVASCAARGCASHERHLREARELAEGAEHARAVAEARLARFEALAAEADMCRQMAGPGEQEHTVSIVDRLAALAGPEGA